MLVWRVALHLGDKTPRNSNFEKKKELSKGDLQSNSRSQCPTCSMLVLCVPISSHCEVLWLSAGCRLGWTSPAASPPAIKSKLLVASQRSMASISGAPVAESTLTPQQLHVACSLIRICGHFRETVL